MRYPERVFVSCPGKAKRGRKGRNVKEQKTPFADAQSPRNRYVPPFPRPPENKPKNSPQFVNRGQTLHASCRCFRDSSTESVCPCYQNGFCCSQGSAKRGHEGLNVKDDQHPARSTKPIGPPQTEMILPRGRLGMCLHSPGHLKFGTSPTPKTREGNTGQERGMRNRNRHRQSRISCHVSFFASRVWALPVRSFRPIKLAGGFASIGC